jgi:hypothetical protein
MSGLRRAAAVERGLQAADTERQHSEAAVAAGAEDFVPAVVEGFAAAVAAVAVGGGRTSTSSTKSFCSADSTMVLATIASPTTAATKFMSG